MTDAAALITAFTTLFLIIDPPGLVPLFIALTRGLDPARKRTIALRAVLVATALLALFMFLGETVLNFVGISIPAFRIAGGVLLFLTALDMLFDRRQTRRKGAAEGEAADPGHDPSVFPLAMPLITGPGAITTVILFAGSAQDAAGYLAVGAVIAANLLIVLVALLAAPYIERLLGATGINVVTRVLGMLLAALAVQFILDGLILSGVVGG